MQRTLLGLLVPGSCLILACSDEHSCTLKQCGGGALQAPLVDDAGNPAAASGEARDSAGYSGAFDCIQSPPDENGPFFCSASLLTLNGINANPGSLVQLRFDLPSGTQTDWQPLTLQQTEHTDPDFNGPGCSCTWYEAIAEPVVVPAGARVAPLE